MVEQTIGQRIRQAIGYRGRSQKDIAKAIGISENALTKIVKGATECPSGAVIRSLALELSVSADYLLAIGDEIELKATATEQ